MTSRPGILRTAALLALPMIALVGLTGTEYLVDQSHRTATGRVHREALDNLSNLREQITSQLTATLYLAYGIEALVDVQRTSNPEALRPALRRLCEKDPIIRNIGIAEGYRVTLVEPLAGNEGVVGIDYRTVPEQWPGVRRVIDRGEPFLAGPIDLVQGGTGLVYRVPVYLNDDRRQFWGLISTVLNCEQLWRTVQRKAPQLASAIIVSKGASDSAGELVFGSALADDVDAVSASIRIPGGEWQLMLPVHHDDVSLASKAASIRAIGLLTTLLACGFLLHLVLQAKRLDDARSRAEHAGRAKTDFLAMMSHEIRTPMNGVIGMTDLLLGTDGLTAQQQCYARTALESARSLTVILDDILDHAKIESGRMTFECINIDVLPFVSGVVELFIGTARHKSLHLEADVDDNVPAVVRGDPTRIRQVLANLVGNAVKFTSEGCVRLAVSYRNEHLHFEITDTGVGIPDDNLEALFSPFEQADSTTTRQFGGTGLGLAIARGLARAMGGDISVSSRVGVGSKFEVVLPAAIGRESSDSGEELADSDSLPEGTRVLVVEDNAINRKVALAMLRRLGLDAEAVDSGEKALTVLGHSSFDLVLMDMQMPGMDGPTTTRAIRARTSCVLDSNIPIVALTANVLNEHRNECLEAGMVGFLSKPLVTKDLAAALRQHLSPRS